MLKAKKDKFFLEELGPGIERTVLWESISLDLNERMCNMLQTKQVYDW